METSNSNCSSSEPIEEMNAMFSYITGETKEFDVRNHPFNIRISKVSIDIARIYFVASDSGTSNSGSKREIPVPDGISIVDIGEKNVLLKPRDNSFFIVQFDSYSLRLNGKEILKFTNPRQHSIRGSESIREITA